MEEINKEQVTREPSSMSRLSAMEADHYLHVSASKKSLNRSPSIGTMVAGFTRALPNIPHETRHEKLKQMQDEANSVDHSILQRQITLISPEAARDKSYIVPNLLQQQSDV